MNLGTLMVWGKRFVKEFIDDRATGLAAEQAFYYMLSLFPMMILMLSIIPYFSINSERVMEWINRLLPYETANMLEETVTGVVSEQHGGLLTFGVIGTIWSASLGLNAFIRVMNQAFDVEVPRPFWKARLLSIFLTIGLMISFIIIFFLSIFGELIIHFIAQFLFLPGQTEVLLQVMRWIITFVVMITILSLLFYLAPNIKISLRYVFPGAILATIIWVLISAGFSFYVNHFGNYSTTYGSLGVFIVLMLWLFFTGLTFVVGGEVNAILHKHRSSAKT